MYLLMFPKSRPSLAMNYFYKRPCRLLCPLWLCYLDHFLCPKGPFPFLPQPHDLLHSSFLRNTSVSFIMEWFALSNEGKYIPKKEIVNKGVKSQSISGQQQSSAHMGIIGINRLAMLQGQELCQKSPYTAMPAPLISPYVSQQSWPTDLLRI